MHSKWTCGLHCDHVVCAHVWCWTGASNKRWLSAYSGWKTLKLETSLECDYLSIHFENHSTEHDYKIKRNELNSSVKHNKINGMCE